MKHFIAAVLIILLLTFVTSLEAIVTGQYLMVLMVAGFWVVVFTLIVVIAKLLVD
ncbi:hypothetical protein XaC1_504 [Xanthomonas phage XaC1]|nr:hypothetical protein XaC1_504 [Xanthomonas phage XaC1]